MKNTNTKNIKEDFYSLDKIGDTFKDVFKVLKDIANALTGLAEGFITGFKLLYWIFKIVMFILIEILNPANLFKDLYNSSKSLPLLIIEGFIRIITTFAQYLVNKVFHPIMNRVFGWDINNEEEDKSVHNKDKKCYKADEGTIPMSVLISTVLLPPLGVFMRFGLNRWLDILITGGLSIMYYFPGLIYGLILIYA